MFNKLNAVFNNCIIGRGAEFGPRFVLIHATGVVINGDVRGGSDVRVEHQVTIGAERRRAPVLGDGVFIGAGAKIIGGVSVGDGARVGANAVVVHDVPPTARSSASRRRSSAAASRRAEIEAAVDRTRRQRWRSHEELTMTTRVEIVFWSCVALIGYAYVVYPIVVWATVTRSSDGRWHATRSRRRDRCHVVSILIAAHNEEKVIADRIANALALDYPAGSPRNRDRVRRQQR